MGDNESRYDGLRVVDYANQIVESARLMRDADADGDSVLSQRPLEPRSMLGDDLGRDLALGLAQESVKGGVVDDDVATACESAQSTCLGDLMRLMPFLARYALPVVEVALGSDDIEAEDLRVEA